MKFTNYIFAFVILTIVVCITGLNRFNFEPAKRRIACKSLNPKYGQLFEVRSGFYEGNLFEATELRANQYVRGYVIQDFSPIAFVKSTKQVILECSILKIRGGN